MADACPFCTPAAVLPGDSPGDSPGRRYYEARTAWFTPSKHKERAPMWVHLAPEVRARMEERAAGHA